MSDAPENIPPEAPEGNFVKEAPLAVLTMEELLESARAESVRALTANSVTAMTYDMIADMVVKAARVLEPRLDDLCVAEPPTPNSTEALLQYKQADTTLLFNDPVQDLWDKEFMSEALCAITRMLAQASCPVKHTLRGQIIRRPLATKPAKFILVVSVLNCESPETKKEPADGEQEREEGAKAS